MKLNTGKITFVLLIITVLLSVCYRIANAKEASTVYAVKINGAITPLTHELLENALTMATADNAEALLVLLDTPGGLDSSMRDCIKLIMNADIPVLVYVYPKGARAASAGLFVLLASNIAAMAPGTSVGAAHPVMPMGQPDATMKEKITKDAISYIRSLAEANGRNAEWAEKAVKESATLTANEAFERHVVEIIAKDIDSALKQADGRQVTVGDKTYALSTKNARVVTYTPGFREKFLHGLSNPNLAYILLMLGIWGLIMEFSRPGFGFPGVTGIVCLVLASFAFQTLPINAAGIVLIIFGIILFVLEVVTPTFGPFTIGGIISVSLGSIMLYKRSALYLKVSNSLIVAFVATSAFLIVFGLTFIIKTYRKKVTTGLEGMVGSSGRAVTALAPGGRIFVHGEYWEALSEDGQKISEGEEVEVTEADGRQLKVKRK